MFCEGTQTPKHFLQSSSQQGATIQDKRCEGSDKYSREFGDCDKHQSFSFTYMKHEYQKSLWVS